MKKTGLHPKELPLGRHLNVLAKYYVGALTKRLEDIDLERHYTLLLTIASGPRLYTQKELGDMMQIDKASMVRNIDYLVKKGLVMRMRGKTDRREYFIQLTVKGEKTVQRIYDGVHELNTVAFNGISSTMQKQFYAMVIKMMQNLKHEPSHSVVLNYKNLGNKKKDSLTRK